jgi:hypothetical protein
VHELDCETSKTKEKHITKISVPVHLCPWTHRKKNTEPKKIYLLIQSRHTMNLLTDQFTYQWVHPAQDNLLNPSLDNNIIRCSCGGEGAGFVCRVCCLLRANQSKGIYHKEFPRIANIPRRLLTLGPKGREEHNVSSTKQNIQWMTWVNFGKAIRCWTSSIVRAVFCGNRRLRTIQTAKCATEGTPLQPDELFNCFRYSYAQNRTF